MDSYWNWYRQRGEVDDHCANRHTWHEPSTQFSFPSTSVADVLTAIFGAEVAEADLLWLAGLLECVLRFENGALIENYLARAPNPSDYALAARKLLRVLHAIDEVMTKSREPTREWQQISLALGLPSSRRSRLTEAAIGRQFGLSTMAISKSISKLLRLAELKPHSRGYNGV